MALELFINGTQSGAVGQINLYGDEPIQLNISVGDIRDISKKNSTFSQTFTIPADANNNILLNHIFNIGADSSFDPSKKTQCFILNDGISVFNGQFQLTKINVKNRNVISYECVVYGETIDLAKALGNKLLTDLDFSELNHARTSYNVEKSWISDTKSLGYYYPLIDYGYDLNIGELNSGVLSLTIETGEGTSGTSTTLVDGFKLWAPGIYAGFDVTIIDGPGIGQTRVISTNTNTQLTVTVAFTSPVGSTSKYIITKRDTNNPYGSTGSGLNPNIFKPALSTRYILNKIVTDANFSIIGDFIDSDILGETIIPYTGVDKGLNTPDIKGFGAYLLGNATGYPVTNPHLHPYDNPSTVYYQLPYSTLGGYDFSGNFNNTTYEYSTPTINSNEMYEFVVNLSYTINTTNLLAQQDPRDGFIVNVYRSSLAVGSFGIPNLMFTYFNSALKTENGIIGEKTIARKLRFPCKFNNTNPLKNYPLQPGERVWAKILPYNINYDSPTPYPYPTDPTIYTFNSDTNFTVNIYTDGVINNYVLMNDYVNKNVKQIDFVKSIITMFNLMVIPDKSNPSRLKFIPRNDYYNNATIKDWSSKVDHTNKIDEILLSEQQNKSIRLTYKSDKDFYNNDYTTKTNTIYGEHIENIDNEWIDGEKKIEVIFSPTPVDKVFGSNDIYLPKIAKRDEKSGIYGSLESNIRFLRKNKAPMLSPTSTIQLKGMTARNTYPYCGHLDHPTEPQIDYNFGQIQFAYYPELTNMTENNLVEVYWQQYLDDINDKNSKLIKCKIYLTPDDIAKFDYNDSIFIDGLTDDGGHYFNVNKITYIPTSNLPSVVELIKVNRKPTEKRRRYTIVGESLPPIRFIDIGKFNTSESGGTFIIGQNNTIGYNAETTMIIGNNNTVANNANNVVIINSSNHNITESFTTIVGNSYFPQQGESYTLFNDIDSGLDMIINPFSNTTLNDIDSGLDAVRNIGGQSIISDIDSGVDGTKI